MSGLTNNCVPLVNSVRQLRGFLRYHIVKRLPAFGAPENKHGLSTTVKYITQNITIHCCFRQNQFASSDKGRSFGPRPP